MSDEHLCAAENCESRIPFGQWMCLPHWNLLHGDPAQHALAEAFARRSMGAQVQKLKRYARDRVRDLETGNKLASGEFLDVTSFQEAVARWGIPVHSMQSWQGSLVNVFAAARVHMLPAVAVLKAAGAQIRLIDESDAGGRRRSGLPGTIFSFSWQAPYGEERDREEDLVTRVMQAIRRSSGYRDAVLSALSFGATPDVLRSLDPLALPNRIP